MKAWGWLAESIQVTIPRQHFRDMAVRVMITFPYETAVLPSVGEGIGQGVMRREPFGVAALISAYNFPFFLNIMKLATPESAILSAIIFNALIIIALIPLALKGVAFRPIGAGALLRRNLLIYGVGGVIIPFIGIKAIDYVVAALHLA